jgi:hypothetical protein
VFTAGEDEQVRFCEASALTLEDLAAVQQQVRAQVLREGVRIVETAGRSVASSTLYPYPQSGTVARRPGLAAAQTSQIVRIAASLPRTHDHRLTPARRDAIATIAS